LANFAALLCALCGKEFLKDSGVVKSPLPQRALGRAAKFAKQVFTVEAVHLKGDMPVGA
jgi:hypothetical protein